MFREKNLHFTILILVGLVITLWGTYINYSNNDTFARGESWIYTGLQISELAGFFLLLVNGTFMKTRYYKVAKGFIAFVLIGALLRILHYGYDVILIGFGFLGIITCYTIHFAKKPIKKRLDYIKLGFVLTSFVISYLRYLHLISSEYQILTLCLIWLAIIDYFMIENQKEKSIKRKQ